MSSFGDTTFAFCCGGDFLVGVTAFAVGNERGDEIGKGEPGVAEMGTNQNT